MRVYKLRDNSDKIFRKSSLHAKRVRIKIIIFNFLLKYENKNKMKIKIIKGVKVKNSYAFMDFRGKYIYSISKTFRKSNFFKMIFPTQKNILRGFHGDSKTWKLFTCVYGKVQFAAINFDKKSKNFKNNFTTIFK